MRENLVEALRSACKSGDVSTVERIVPSIEKASRRRKPGALRRHAAFAYLESSRLGHLDCARLLIPALDLSLNSSPMRLAIEDANPEALMLAIDAKAHSRIDSRFNPEVRYCIDLAYHIANQKSDWTCAGLLTEAFSESTSHFFTSKHEQALKAAHAFRARREGLALHDSTPACPTTRLAPRI